MITMLPMITVHAQDLKAGREMIIDQPFIDSHSPEPLSMLFPVVVDVIDAKEKGFGFSAAGATITTVSHNDHILQLVVVVKAMGAMFISMIDIPSGSTFNVGLSIFTPRGANVVNGFELPILDPFFCASLALVPPPTTNDVGDFKFIDWLWNMAFLAFSVHDFLQVVSVILIKSYYENQVKGKAQRPSGNGVGLSGPKRRAARTADDMVCSCG